jgi:peroxiredoxin
MIKKCLAVLAMMIGVSAMAQTEKPFSIKGQFTNMPNAVQKVFISYRLGDGYKTDSIVPINGNYSFAGKLSEPVLASLRIRYEKDAEGKAIKITDKDLLSIFIGAENVYVSSVDSFSNAKITGSKTNEEYKKLTALLKPLRDKRREAIVELTQARKYKEEAAMKAASDKIDALDLEIQEMNGVYVKQNTQSLLAPFMLSEYAGWDINPANLEPVLAKFSAEQKETPRMKELLGRIELAKKTAVGQMAMEFVQNDTLGNPVALSSLRGKYLLVDFWASWCGPCREENPNVVKAYQAYKDKGFTILGVSLDQAGQKQRWIDAIHKDNLTWTHVSDLKFWQSDVVKQYGIYAIPQNLLLDPKGKIVARNLSGEKLTEKLAELLP